MGTTAIADVCFACSCAQSSETENYNNSDVVFTGTALRSREARDSADSEKRIAWVFDVDAVQKGGASPEQTVYTFSEQNSCAQPFQAGKRYQVYGKVNTANEVETNLCSGNRSLGSGEDPKPPEDAVVTASPGGGARGNPDEPDSRPIGGEVIDGPAKKDRDRNSSTDQASPEGEARSSSLRTLTIAILVVAVIALVVVLAVRRPRRPSP